MKIPHDHMNAQIKKLPRPLQSDTEWLFAWSDGEAGVLLTWPDGFHAFVGFGPEATAAIEASRETRH